MHNEIHLTLAFFVLLQWYQNDCPKTVVLANSPWKYFHQYLEEHDILTFFKSGDRTKDLYKHMDISPSFRIVIIPIGINDAQKIVLHKFWKSYRNFIRIFAAEAQDPRYLLFNVFLFHYFITHVLAFFGHSDFILNKYLWKYFPMLIWP